MNSIVCMTPNHALQVLPHGHWPRLQSSRLEVAGAGPPLMSLGAILRSLQSDLVCGEPYERMENEQN